MSTPNLNAASQPWGRAVTASVGRVDSALTGAQSAAVIADGNLQNSITRAAVLTTEAKAISDYMLTLAVVKAESRTNAIGV